MKLPKIKLKEFIFAELNEMGLTPIKENQVDHYFIFDATKNSIWHFKIKECRGWLCGLRIVDNPDNKDQYKISLFAQREAIIDKFKPSCSNICAEYYIVCNFI